MKSPSVTSNQLVGLRNYLSTGKVLRQLEGDGEVLEAISSACPPLDYVTGCNGFPRGRIIELFGAESTGKCLVPGTYVSVPGRGILTLAELTEEVEWQDSEWETKQDQVGSLRIPVSAAMCPDHVSETNGMYYAGVIPTLRVFTEQGHPIRGSLSHRVLVLPSTGLARWTKLENLRPGDQMFTLIDQRVEGTGQIQFSVDQVINDRLVKEFDTEAAAALMGICNTAEIRNEELWLITSTNSQRKLVKELAKEVLGLESPFEESVRWMKFTGLAKLNPAMQQFAYASLSYDCLKSIRTAPLNLQKAWLAGISLTRGEWTGEDLEIELLDKEVARMFQSLSANVGVRWNMFTTLNTLGEVRYKLALRGRIDQQRAEEEIWDGYNQPRTWKKRYSSDVEDENHPNATATLKYARDILERAGVPFEDIELEDLSKENMREVADRVFKVSKTQTACRVLETLQLLGDEAVSVDRVTGVEKATPAPCMDLSVPIGSHYATNSVISHNSTLALHMCNRELIQNQEAACVYLDYERSTASTYARALGLLAHGGRFLLVDPATLEQGDQIIRDIFDQSIYPSLIVIDSIPAMTPEDLFGRDLTKTAPIGLQSRKLAECLGKWVKEAADHGVSFILINQTRTYIETEKFQSKKRKTLNIPGLNLEKEATPGGVAVKFYSAMRIRLEAKKIICNKNLNVMTGETEEIPVANVVKAVAVKNKCAAPYRAGQFFIEFGKGVDLIRTMLEVGKSRSLVGGHGGHYKVVAPDGTEYKASGELNFIELLKENEAARKSLLEALQWDDAAAVAGQVLEIVSYSLEDEGEDAEDTLLSLASKAIENNVTVSALERSPSLAHKAQILGLVTSSKGAFSYSSGIIGENEKRSRNLPTLDKKLSPKERQELSKKIDLVTALIQEQEAPETLDLDSSNPEESGVQEETVDVK